MNIILVGGGGYCKSVIDVAESASYRVPAIQFLVYLTVLKR